MISAAIFARYARSLAEVVLEKGDEAAVSRDLAMYGEIFQTVPDLLEAFDSPAVPRDAKERVLSELMARYPAGQTTANFLRLLLDHNRIRHFQEISDNYGRILNERRGIVAAQVTSAVPLGEPELVTLRESLARALGRIVILKARTDPELLGGLVVQVGSTVYDGSIRTQLTEMSRRLVE